MKTNRQKQKEKGLDSRENAKRNKQKKSSSQPDEDNNKKKQKNKEGPGCPILAEFRSEPSASPQCFAFARHIHRAKPLDERLIASLL